MDRQLCFVETHIDDLLTRNNVVLITDKGIAEHFNVSLMTAHRRLKALLGHYPNATKIGGVYVFIEDEAEIDIEYAI